MFLRRLVAPAFAAVMLTGLAATASAQAQTETQHHPRSGRHHGQAQQHTRTQPHAQDRHHGQAQHHTGRTHRAARGGATHDGTRDRGPTTSDRGAADRLNAQSLEQARGGADAVR